MNATINKINNWLIKYLQQPGDSEETLMDKKIWWLFCIGGFPFLLIMSLVIGNNEGITVIFLNSIFVIALLTGLVIFHFHKKNIEQFALITQIFIVLISSVKVYLLGGLLHAGGVIFIGLLAPLYALTLPNKKRAIIIFLLYMSLMFIATLLQPDLPKNYLLYYYFLGFFIGNSMAFIGLYYYTSEVERLKKEEKQRMGELDEFKTKFYTNITHEFRTPLTIILGMTEQMKANPEKWLDDGLKMIKRNGQNLLNLTNQMLDLSKLEANFMPVNLIQDDIALYLKYLVESFHSLAEAKNIGISFLTDPEEIRMDFDPDKILDILSNLLSNAIKFTPKGGSIQISVSKEEKATESDLILSVKDNGTGIPAKHLYKVFERYFRAESINEQLPQGSGLGLALTRELVKLLKGEITVKSRLNKGTIFTVRLPITNKEKKRNQLLSKVIDPPILSSEKSKQSPHHPKEETNKKLVLLIVEDNKDVLRYLRSILHNDYQIEVAGDGNAGFEKAIEIIPDLVLSDVMMPAMDGFSFCKKLKNDLRTSHIPVVLLTAKVDAESKMTGLRAGADAYLAKPFNQQELHLRIQKLIELRKALHDRYKFVSSNNIDFELEENHISIKEDTFIQSVREILELHIAEEEFGIAELCLNMGMSRSQLYRKFSALTNTSLHHFIRKMRLVKARELLQTTELNVSEIAYDTGFKNLSHFSRVYSQEFGVAPSKERGLLKH
jgi:signal transduction histidine kinase/DNA-binding response OmpR family regulator